MPERTTEITKMFSCMTVQSLLMIPVFIPGRFIFFWGFFYRNVKKINLLLWMNTFKIMWMSKKHV